MFGRSLDESFAPEIKRNISAVVIARLTANACYRFAPPFLAIIAKSFDVSLADIGIAVFVSELTGFASPFLGRVVDRLSHRNTMVLGLLGTGIGCSIAAAAPNVFVFALGVTFLGLTKQSFDLGLGAWIADFVPYNQRGKVVGIAETGWALGLLVGVSLMGIVTALTNWRVGYALGVAAIVVCTAVLLSRINNEPRTNHVPSEGEHSRIKGRNWLVLVTMFCIMCSVQNLFVTFGAWLEDDFGFGAARLAVVGFSFGAVELIASVSSARYTDRVGKEISIIGGAMLIVPAGIALALGSANLFVGVVAAAIFFLGFEFAIVSLLPIASQLVPNSPGTGLGWVLGAGTLGRAIMAIVATRSYEQYGMVAPSLIGAGFGLLGAVAIYIYQSLGGVPDHQPR
jgi:predicted MFS family arabinose efflux permease